MKVEFKKILSFILSFIIVFCSISTYSLISAYAGSDTDCNIEAFVPGGGYIYFKGWAASKDMKCVIQYPSSLYRAITMYYRQDLVDADHANAYGFDGVIGMKSGTYSGDDKFVLVCWTANDIGYRVIEKEFTILKPHVILNLEGGSGGTTSFDVEYGDYPAKISIPTKVNCDFLGYYTGKNGTGTRYINSDGSGAKAWAETGGANDNPTTSYNLYAYWKAHEADTPVFENFITPTCVTDGGYDIVVYCKNTLNHNSTKTYNTTYETFETYA